MSLVLGLMFILAGVYMLIYPVVTFETLIVMFSVFMFVSGIFEIFFSLSNTRSGGWGWYLVLGIVDVLLGFYLMFHPGLVALVIPFVIALWLLFRGLSVIGFSIDFHDMGMKGWGWYLLLGILAVICSVMIIWRPIAGAALAIYMTAFSFMLIGIYRTTLAFSLRKLGRKEKEE